MAGRPTRRWPVGEPMEQGFSHGRECGLAMPWQWSAARTSASVTSSPKVETSGNQERLRNCCVVIWCKLHGIAQHLFVLLQPQVLENLSTGGPYQVVSGRRVEGALRSGPRDGRAGAHLCPARRCSHGGPEFGALGRCSRKRKYNTSVVNATLMLWRVSLPRPEERIFALDRDAASKHRRVSCRVRDVSSDR